MTSRLTSRSPCLELKTIGDPSKFNQSRHVGIYEYSDRDIEGIAYYPSNAPATNAHFDASLKRVPIVFIVQEEPVLLIIILGTHWRPI